MTVVQSGRTGWLRRGALVTLVVALMAAGAVMPAGAAKNKAKKDVDPKGVLRIAEVTTAVRAGTFDFDPTKSVSPEPDFQLQRLVYGVTTRCPKIAPVKTVNP